MKNIRQLLAIEYKIYSNRYDINIQKIKDNNLMQEYKEDMEQDIVLILYNQFPIRCYTSVV